MTGQQKVVLSNVCNISMGQAPKGSSYNDEANGYPLIAGAGDFGTLTPNPGKYTNAPTKLSKPGEIIICIRATIGDRNWSDRAYCLGRGVAGLQGKNGILEQKYLWHWLGHATPELKSKGRGATFLQVSKSDIASLQIPLPPLAEQKRIAGILDAADALRARRRESLAQLDTLLQATFLDMFGDPVTNPMGWEVASGAEVFLELTYGTSTKSLNEPTSNSIPVLRIPNIIRGQIDWNNLKYTEPTKKESEKLSLLVDDLLFVRSNGNPDYIGRCARFNGTRKALFASYLIRGRLNITSGLESEYLKHQIEFPSYRHKVRREARTTAGNYNLSTAGIRKFQFTIPPLNLQRRFAAIVEAVERQKARQRAHLAELDTLFAALQQRAFTGEL